MSQVLINVRNIRVSKGYSQEYVASQINISQSSYTRFESGRSKTLFEIIEKVASFFDMSVEAVLNHHKKSQYPLAVEESHLAEDGDNYRALAEEVKLLRQVTTLHQSKIEELERQLTAVTIRKARPKKKDNG